MHVIVVEPPPEPVVSTELAKQHLSVESDDFDALIEAYVAAGSGQLDGPDGWLGRALGLQTLEAQLDGFGHHWRRDRRPEDRRPWSTIPLPYPPLIEIVSIKYDDPAGIEQVLDPAGYRLSADGVTRVGPADWPATFAGPACVRIRYSAGYAAIPPAITLAILLMVGDAFENRGTTDIGRVAQIPMSVAVETLLSPFRVWFADRD